MAIPECIYRNPAHPTVDVPQLDLLTLLFDSEHCLAQDESVLHISAENPSRSLNKLQLRRLVQQIAYCLRNSFQVGARSPCEDVVTVITSGQPMAPAVFLGIIAAGGVHSGASPSSSVNELTRQIRTSQSGLIICSEEFRTVARRAAKQSGNALNKVLVMKSDPQWSLSRLSNETANLLNEYTHDWTRITDPCALKESLIAIVWSSGTTGSPKGVMLSHRNLVSQTFITHLTGREAAAKQVAEGTYVAHEFRTLAHLPSSHISGLFGYFISTLYGAGLVVWMRKYEWKAFLKYVKQYKITYFFTVPSIYLRIAKSPDVTDQFSHLVAASTGSAPMDAELQRNASARLGFKSNVIGPSWGLSETTGGVTMTAFHQNDEIGSLGYIMPGLEVRMVNEQFEDVRGEEPGELLVRGPTVTNGYYDNLMATKQAFHKDWFCTGDIAVRRKGKFFIVDRKKELLKYKGLQIAPAELENLLFTHPNIQEAAIVGVPVPEDPSSEVPRAYVVADSARVSEVEIKDYVKDRLAPYKQLRGGVVFVDEIPKNANGKILRRQLREIAKKESEDSKEQIPSRSARVAIRSQL